MYDEAFKSAPEDATVVDAECHDEIDYNFKAIGDIDTDDFKGNLSNEFISAVKGTYKGTYTGQTNDSSVERTATLVISDCKKDGSIEGFVDVTGGDYYMSYKFDGAISEEDGTIVYYTTDWVFRPSDNCASQEFIGTFNKDKKTLEGDNFSYRKTSTRTAIYRNKEDVPQFWTGMYVGSYSTSSCGSEETHYINRKFLVTINRISDEGSFVGSGHVYRYYGDGRAGEVELAYDCSGKIDFETGYTYFQGYEITEDKYGDAEKFTMCEFVSSFNIVNSNGKFALGDVNKDTKVNLQDTQIVLKAALAIVKLEEDQTQLADVNNDDKVNLRDAQLVLQAALGIIEL